jgi:hypothetical protein
MGEAKRKREYREQLAAPIHIGMDLGETGDQVAIVAGYHGEGQTRIAASAVAENLQEAYAEFKKRMEEYGIKLSNESRVYAMGMEMDFESFSRRLSELAKECPKEQQPIKLPPTLTLREVMNDKGLRQGQLSAFLAGRPRKSVPFPYLNRNMNALIQGSQADPEPPLE